MEIGLEVCDWAIICWIWFGIWCLAYKLELAYKLVQGHFVGKLANAGGPSNAEIGL